MVKLHCIQFTHCGRFNYIRSLNSPHGLLIWARFQYHLTDVLINRRWYRIDVSQCCCIPSEESCTSVEMTVSKFAAAPHIVCDFEKMSPYGFLPLEMWLYNPSVLNTRGITTCPEIYSSISVAFRHTDSSAPPRFPAMAPSMPSRKVIEIMHALGLSAVLWKFHMRGVEENIGSFHSGTIELVNDFVMVHYSDLSVSFETNKFCQTAE